MSQVFTVTFDFGHGPDFRQTAVFDNHETAKKFIEEYEDLYQERAYAEICTIYTLETLPELTKEVFEQGDEG